MPSGDASLTQAGACSRLHRGGQRGNTLSLQGRNQSRWRNLLSTGETVQLHTQTSGGCTPRGERAGPSASGRAHQGPVPPTFPLRGPVVTRWQWSISVRLWGSPEPRETPLHPPNLSHPLRADPRAMPGAIQPQYWSKGTPDWISANPSCEALALPWIQLVFWLRFYLGGKNEDLGCLAGISPATVSVLDSRALSTFLPDGAQERA